MTNRALTLINSFAARLIAGVLGELDRPGHLIRIYIENSSFRIKCRASPLPAAIESRKDDCVFVCPQWNKLPFAAIAPKLLQCPLMRLRSAVGQHVFRQSLTRIRRWFRRK